MAILYSSVHDVSANCSHFATLNGNNDIVIVMCNVMLSSWIHDDICLWGELSIFAFRKICEFVKWNHISPNQTIISGSVEIIKANLCVMYFNALAPVRFERNFR